MQKMRTFHPPATAATMAFWLILWSIIMLTKCTNPAATTANSIGEPLHTSDINTCLDAAVLKAERAREDPFAYSPVKLLINNPNFYTTSTEHLSTLQPMLCTAPSAGMLHTALCAPFKFKIISHLTHSSRFFSGADGEYTAVFISKPAVKHRQCDRRTRFIEPLTVLSNSSPLQSLPIGNLPNTSNNRSPIEQLSTVNMAPASRNTTTTRAKSAKSAGQDYVLRNKPKPKGKKSGAADKSLDDLPGETLFPPKLANKTPNNVTPASFGEVSPEPTDTTNDPTPTTDGAAPGRATSKTADGAEEAAEQENINDPLNSINNPPKADGEDDVEMAAEEEAHTPDPSKTAAASPSSSPVKKKKKQSSTAPVDTSATDKTTAAKEGDKEKKRKARKETKTKTAAQPASVLKTGKLGSGSRLSFADEAPKKAAPYVHKHKNVIECDCRA